MADEPQRFCLGIAYMPGPDRRITKGKDGGRDFLTEAELEKAAWTFLLNGPQVNAFHMAGTEGVATVVESSIHRGPDWDLGDGIVCRQLPQSEFLPYRLDQRLAHVGQVYAHVKLLRHVDIEDTQA